MLQNWRRNWRRC